MIFFCFSCSRFFRVCFYLVQNLLLLFRKFTIFSFRIYKFLQFFGLLFFFWKFFLFIHKKKYTFAKGSRRLCEFSSAHSIERSRCNYSRRIHTHKKDFSSFLGSFAVLFFQVPCALVHCLGSIYLFTWNWRMNFVPHFPSFTPFSIKRMNFVCMCLWQTGFPFILCVSFLFRFRGDCVEVSSPILSQNELSLRNVLEVKLGNEKCPWPSCRITSHRISADISLQNSYFADTFFSLFISSTFPIQGNFRHLFVSFILVTWKHFIHLK